MSPANSPSNYSGQGVLQPWSFSGIQADSRLILAPMDGYTDSPFRQICRAIGSGFSVSEFLDTNDILHNTLSFSRRSRFLSEERPIFLQILGDDPAAVELAASRLIPLQPDGIDLNLGCPSRHVCSRGAGSALLKSPDKISAMISRLAKLTKIPISVKIRLGWDEYDRNYLQIARIVEDQGASIIAVHGRTRQQGYKGPVDYEAIREIKESLRIPVIANGNIVSPADISDVFNRTGADAVMIGRAAVTNPWIFSLRNREEISPAEVKNLFLSHLTRSMEHNGYPLGLINFRKFAKGYLKPYRKADEIFPILLRTLDLNQFLDLVVNFLEGRPEFSETLGQ